MKAGEKQTKKNNKKAPIQNNQQTKKTATPQQPLQLFFLNLPHWTSLIIYLQLMSYVLCPWVDHPKLREALSVLQPPCRNTQHRQRAEETVSDPIMYELLARKLSHLNVIIMNCLCYLFFVWLVFKYKYSIAKLPTKV